MNWQKINLLTRTKVVYLYGRSEDWVHKAVSQLMISPKCIIDRETSYHGTEYLGLRVVPFEDIEYNDDAFFVITAADYGGIVETLEDIGYKKNIHYALSPDFASYEVLCAMRDHKANLLISCSDYNDQKRARSSLKGGGIYILNTENQRLEKVITGSFRQVIRLEDRFITTDYVEKAVIVFDSEFRIIHKQPLDLPNFCGIAADTGTGLIYLANAGVDIIYTLDIKGLHKTGEIKIANPYPLNRKSHHLNDFYIRDGILYFSYFSRVGQWKQGIFDGGLSALPCTSLDTAGEMCIPEPLVSNLWKPHSPMVINNEIYVLDSMRGYLLNGTNNRMAKLPGFARGLDYDGKYFYIGISEDMYVVDRRDPNGCMLNAGVFTFDSSNRAFRFVPTYGIMNIHSIVALDS